MMKKMTFFVLLLPLILCASAASAAGGRRAQKFSPLSDSMRQLKKTPSFATMEAFKKFSLTQGPGWRVRYNPRTALPEAIIGGRTLRYSGSPEEAAASFLSDNAALLDVDFAQLRLAYKKDFLGATHLNYQQFYNGIPVEFSYVRLHVDKDGAVSGYQSKYQPDINLSLVPLVSPAYAASAALADMGYPLKVKKTSLVIFPDEAEGVLKLAWKILSRGRGAWIYYVDAANGKVLFKYDDLRYAMCLSPYNISTGTVTGSVYDISPIATGNSDLNNPPMESVWTPTSIKPISDQYVWVGSYSSFTVTDTDGQYCSNLNGKVFASLKGPYFSVTNFRGPNAHFDNGGGRWRGYSTPVHNLSPYTVTIPSSEWSASETFAKVMPHFASFQVGELDLGGTILDGSELSVNNPLLTGNNTVADYIGKRTSGFYGASVESPSYELELHTDPSGASPNFIVDISSYLVLTNNPGMANNNTGSICWSTGSVVQSSTSTAVTLLDRSLDGSYGALNSLAEVNAFYHLTKARRYFAPINLNPLNPDPNNPPAALGRVPVMVHAHGEADNIDVDGGMQNAYYDFDNDNILIGDGPMDANGKFRSFALDGTIVRHEYVHKVVNQIYPIINFGEFGAVSEAMADYFSIASLQAEGNAENNDAKKTLSTLGNFIGAGEGTARDISGLAGSKKMPDNWAGEVHDDSLILSQALYSLRDGGSRSLGTFPGTGIFPGQQRADVYIFEALFYFPDNFANFLDAMEMVCRRLESANCDHGPNYLSSIKQAFIDHGISTTPAGGDIHEPNNGPAWATDISSLSAVSGTIYPVADVDYYSITLKQGTFTARLSLPSIDQNYGIYSAFALYLFDANRKYLAEAVPAITNPSAQGGCPMDGTCKTESPVVTLQYNISPPDSYPGRYYLMVAAVLNDFSGNSNTVSLSPYALNIDYTPQGSAYARITTPGFDSDIIDFEAPYASFNAGMNPALPNTPAAASAEMAFEYAQLRDHNYRALELTKTSAAGTYMTLLNSVSYTDSRDYLGRYKITGQVRLQNGFADRYPGVGTVYLEIFGRNRLGSVVSLGVSDAINLSTNKSDMIAYNNILNTSNLRASIKYGVQSAGTLSIKVYTQSGTFVKTIFEGAVPAGKGTVDWDGTNANGSKVASGIYYVKANGPGLRNVEKIAVVR
ncbi:MAG TPA: hypothetical protein DCL44_06460 [Elusimicrobia bacterium]|nr:hypothetical protein [Elusimicrobiota bacterium]